MLFVYPGEEVIFRFGDIVVEPGQLRVTKGKTVVEVEPRAIRVLIYLIERKDRIVPKEELFEHVWQGAAVTDNALTRVIAQLRKALGDDAKQARYIETIPTVGYRFVGKLTSRRQWIWWIPAAAAALLAVVLLPARIPTPFHAGQLRQITNSPTLDAGATFSPDGRSIAYSSDRTGQFEIYVRPLSGPGNEVQITNDGGGSVHAAWSPDGTAIAYHSLTRGGICVVPATGGAIRRLTGFGSHPAWSPDGKRIAFRSTRMVSFAPLDAVTVVPAEIWIVDPASGEAKPVIRAAEKLDSTTTPSWTPDGKQILFSRARSRDESEIAAMDVASGKVTSLHGSPGTKLSPVMAPDGKSVYYGQFIRAESSGIWRLSAPGWKAAEIYRTAGVPQELKISPDGKSLLFSSVETHSNLWKLPIAGGPPSPVTNNTNFRNTFPAISPDGTRVAYIGRRLGTPPQVMLIALDGSGPEPLSNQDAGRSSPVWLPDGGGIALLRNVDDGARVEVVSLSDRIPRLLPVKLPPSGLGRISPDGKQAVFNTLVDGHVRVMRADFETGRRTLVESGPEPATFPNFSPDSKRIAVELLRNYSAHIAVLPAEGGAPDILTDGIEQAWCFGWSPDGEWISFAGQRGGAWNIYAISTKTKREKKFTDLRSARTFVRYPAWADKAGVIVYEFTESKGNIHLLALE
jgi:Tol biopolymer transport system component/DNA-binding winged helix-turn-helix (wHTH) protein